MMNWINFKDRSEDKFSTLEFEEVYGYQIQPGSKWNNGLNQKQIQELEKTFGFELPYDYKAMISIINGLDQDQVFIDPEGKENNEFKRNLYKYPDDLIEIEWLVNEIKENTKYVHEALIPYGYDTK